MNFYSFHIGDYAAHTRRLSLTEDLAYRRMIDEYYLQETPLDLVPAAIARRIGMRDYVADVEYVLSQFFELQEDGWHSARCDKEIEIYHAKQEQASRAGRASAESRKRTSSTEDQRASNTRSTDVQPTNNQEPITNNQEPVKTKKAAPSSEVSLPEWIANDSFEAFIEHRKKLKAPMTNLAQTRVLAELSRLREDGNEPHAVIDQSIRNGWKGVFPLKHQAGAPAGSKAARQQQDKEWLDELTGRSKRDIIDITPT